MKDELVKILNEIENYAAHGKDERLKDLVNKAKIKYSKERELILIDTLTNLFNRRGLKVRLDELVKEVNRDQYGRKREHKGYFSVVMSDLDFFKKYNDSYGHPEGDKLLKKYSKIMKQSIRPLDIAARYGGEEFIFLLPETDAEGATIVAERAREKLKQETAKEGRPVTASFGITTYPIITKDRTRIIANADNALYSAKKSGRDRVVIYSRK